MNNSLYKQQGMEINLREIIWDLLSQWKAVLIAALIMMLLVTGAKYHRDSNAYDAAMQDKEAAQTESTPDERIADILEALPDDEVATVEYMIKQNEWIETEKEYMNNSILMNTNPANQRTLLLDYFISASDSAESKMTALMYGYAGYLSNEKLINSVGQIIAPGTDSKYIAELISANSDNSGKQSGNYTLITDSASDGAVMEVRIVLPDEADAAAVESAVTTALTGYTSELGNKIGNHEISLISSSEAYLFNNVAVTNHNNIMSTVYNLQNNAKNMKMTLSDGQKAAIESITAIKKEAAAAAQEVNDESEKEVVEAEPSRPGISKKYAVLGFVLGALIYAFIYVLLIIITGRVNYASDAERYTQSRLLGEIYTRTENKTLRMLMHSNLVNKYRYRNKTDADLQMEKLSDTLEAVCRHEGIQDAVVINLAGERSKAMLNKIAEKVSAKGLNINPIEISEDVEEKSLLSLTHALIAMDSKTKISKVTKTASLCNDYDVNTLGSVFIGEI